jgi:hypothetical protein
MNTIRGLRSKAMHVFPPRIAADPQVDVLQSCIRTQVLSIIAGPFLNLCPDQF